MQSLELDVTAERLVRLCDLERFGVDTTNSARPLCDRRARAARTLDSRASALHGATQERDLGRADRARTRTTGGRHDESWV